MLGTYFSGEALGQHVPGPEFHSQNYRNKNKGKYFLWLGCEASAGADEGELGISTLKLDVGDTENVCGGA